MECLSGENLKLNLGAGDWPMDGYISVDLREGKTAFPLEVPDASCEEIYASHLLEHFHFLKAPEVLAHWVSKLQPGGRIRLSVPDLKWIMTQYSKGVPIRIQDYLMGAGVDDHDYHGSVFDYDFLFELMAKCGLTRIGRFEPEIKDTSSLPVSLNMQGFKPSADVKFDPKTIVAIESVPRFGPTMHSGCAIAAVSSLHINLHLGQGAYWHQVLSEQIEDKIANPDVKYLLTIDYDTIFKREDVLELLRLLEVNPAADCVTAVQQKRRSDTILVQMPKTLPSGEARESTYRAEFQRLMTQIRTAHFGLTVFRAEKLRALPRPWMEPRPNKTEGRWRNGQQDADMSFWTKWEEAGNTVFLANRVMVGHMCEVVLWPGEDLSKPIMQTLEEFLAGGIPAECKR